MLSSDDAFCVFVAALVALFGHGGCVFCNRLRCCEVVFGFVFETMPVQALSWTHVLIYKPPGGGRYR